MVKYFGKNSVLIYFWIYVRFLCILRYLYLSKDKMSLPCYHEGAFLKMWLNDKMLVSSTLWFSSTLYLYPCKMKFKAQPSTGETQERHE